MDKRPHLKSGQKIRLSNDVYTINRLLTKGGTSLIYEAERVYCDQADTNSFCVNKKVLLKELIPLNIELKRSPSGEIHFINADISGMKKVFENEISNLAYVQYHNKQNNRIPEMDAYGEFNNTVYIAMNHIKGELLSSYISKNVLSDESIMNIFHQILDILHFLHNIDHSYCHLDLKPDNFIVDSIGTVYLFDFGSSLIIDETWVNNYTEHYSAPEVVYNMLELVGQQSDIYSLGAILYEMVTREMPALDKFLLCGDQYCDARFCTAVDYNVLLKRMLNENVTERFKSISDIKKSLQAHKLTKKPVHR